MTLSHSIITLNANGLRNSKNRYKLFTQLKGKADIILLQETHSQTHDEQIWPSSLGGGRMIFSHGDSNSLGVAIYLNKNADFQITIVDIVDRLYARARGDGFSVCTHLRIIRARSIHPFIMICFGENKRDLIHLLN